MRPWRRSTACPPVSSWRAAHCQARDIRREAPAVAEVDANSYWNLLDQVYGHSETPSRVVRREEALGALLTSISGLSDSHRRVIELRFLEGCSVSEAAQEIGISEPAVVALTRRALDALRRHMDGMGEFTRIR